MAKDTGFKPQRQNGKTDGDVPPRTPLQLLNLWRHEGRHLTRWSPASQRILSASLSLLLDGLKPLLSPRFTHVKGCGGVKGTVKRLAKQIGAFRFMARFDIVSYYGSIRHRTLLDLLVKAGVEESLRALVPQYLEVPDPNRTSCGIVAGEALSPLLGALYLLPLDDAMKRLVAKDRIYYLRYMDEMVLLARTRWHLRTAIRELIRVTVSMGLEVHQQKRFISRTDNGG